MNKQVEAILIDLFMHLADAADGGERLPKHLLVAYKEAFKTKEFADFYSELVENNPMNALL